MTQEEVIILSILVSSHLKSILKRKVVLQTLASIKMLNTSYSFPTSAKGNMANVTSHLFPFIKAQDYCLIQHTGLTLNISVMMNQNQQQQSFIYQEMTLSKVISFPEDIIIIQVENHMQRVLKPKEGMRCRGTDPTCWPEMSEQIVRAHDLWWLS